MHPDSGIDHALPHPAPTGATIYHWRGGLLLLAQTLLLDRPTAPIAATLRIALGQPYTIEVEDRILTTRASLVAPKQCRKQLTAVNSELALFYLPIERPEYASLRQRLGNEPIVELDIALFEPVLSRLRAAFERRLSGPQVKVLALDTLALVAGPADVAPAIDPRISKVCTLLAETPLNQFDLNALARKVHLSPSRLRSLFKQQIGHPIGEYARWCATWLGVNLWQPGRTFTDIAFDAGFFDLAHSDRTFVEVFGMSPSLAIDSNFVTLINCDQS